MCASIVIPHTGASKATSPCKMIHLKQLVSQCPLHLLASPVAAVPMQVQSELLEKAASFALQEGMRGSLLQATGRAAPANASWRDPFGILVVR